MMITYDDFAKLELRIGTIKSAERVENTDRLLKIEVDLGNETRQIVAGIAQAVTDPSDLVGTQVTVVANLELRMIRGIESEGMLLAAEKDGIPVVLQPAQPVEPGSQVH